MPTLSVNGIDYAYEERGSGTPVVFAHGLTFDRHMWDPQVAALSAGYRCIAYDMIGHGGSSAAGGPYSFEDEAENLHALLGQWNASPAHVVGLSMGGMMAMRLAIAYPQDVLSLALFDTSAEEEESENVPRYEALVAASRGPNVAAVAEAVAAIMFSATFRASHPDVVAAYKESYTALDFDAVEPALKAVTGRTNVLAALSRVGVPALVVVGSEDAATAPDRAQHIAEAIPGARLEMIAGAGHMSVIEQPQRAAELLSSFLGEVVGGGAK
jgi:pimeloyl-ACP methyl ester carboxylesterase